LKKVVVISLHFGKFEAKRAENAYKNGKHFCDFFLELNLAWGLNSWFVFAYFTLSTVGQLLQGFGGHISFTD
jgi:hypothetical protein